MVERGVVSHWASSPETHSSVRPAALMGSLRAFPLPADLSLVETESHLLLTNVKAR